MFAKYHFYIDNILMSGYFGQIVFVYHGVRKQSSGNLHLIAYFSICFNGRMDWSIAVTFKKPLLKN